MVGAAAMPTTLKLLPHARRLVRTRRPAFFKRNPVHARRTSQATILTKALENAKNSSMVGAEAMLTGSKLLPHARRLVRTRRPVFFQRNPVYARRVFRATILTKWLENAKNSSMADAVAMPTTLQLRGHAIKNVSTKKKGKDRL